MEIVTPDSPLLWLFAGVLFGLMTIAALKGGAVEIYGTNKSFSRKDQPVQFWALTALTTLLSVICCILFLLIFTFG